MQNINWVGGAKKRLKNINDLYLQPTDNNKKIFTSKDITNDEIFLRLYLKDQRNIPKEVIIKKQQKLIIEKRDKTDYIIPSKSFNKIKTKTTD